MERDPLRTQVQPSVEEQVHRVIEAGERAKQTTEHEVSAMADTAGDSTQSTTQKVVDKAKDLVSDLRSKDMTEITGDIKDKASELGSQASNRADVALTATGDRMQDLAQTVRQKAPEGAVGDMAQKAAGALERGGTYLQQANLDDMRGDLEQIIRRRPVESLLVGLGVGFLLARALRR